MTYNVLQDFGEYKVGQTVDNSVEGIDFEALVADGTLVETPIEAAIGEEEKPTE